MKTEMLRASTTAKRNAGILSDMEIYGKHDNVWYKPSQILSTTFHELGHAAHFTNSNSNYKSAERKTARELGTLCAILSNPSRIYGSRI